MRFDELGLNDKILEAISYMDYEKASEIQELTIPAILDGKDIFGMRTNRNWQNSSIYATDFKPYFD